MMNFAQSLLPSSNICCPQGAVAQNGICYCTKEQSSSSPFACGVVCESMNHTLPPGNGGCECPLGFAGERCDQKPCYVFSHQSSSGLNLYCLDAVGNPGSSATGSSVRTANVCSNLGNLIPAGNYTSVFQPCPCLNGGVAFSQETAGDAAIHGCLCPEPFVGDLCHIEPYDASSADTTDPVTANTFLAIIAFGLLVITIAICCGRRHQRMRRRKIANDFHRHDMATAEYRRSMRRPTDIFASYVPILPNLLTSLENTVLSYGGGNKKDGLLDEIPMQEVAPTSVSKTEEPEKEKKAHIVFEHPPHDMIKREKS